MCLVNETPTSIPEVIGYCVVDTSTDGNYVSCFFPRFNYLKHERYIAEYALFRYSPNAVFKDYCYCGFHGFKSRSHAQKFREGLFPRSTLVIVKCKFEDVLAEGETVIGVKFLPSFRAKYRTILEEIKE